MNLRWLAARISGLPGCRPTTWQDTFHGSEMVASVTLRLSTVNYGLSFGARRAALSSDDKLDQKKTSPTLGMQKEAKVGQAHRRLVGLN